MITLKRGTRTLLTSGNTKLGVMEDVNAKYVPFHLPKEPEAGINLLDGVIYVVYINAKGDTYTQQVVDVMDEGEYVDFRWLLDRSATIAHGQVQFAIDFRHTTDDVIDKRWQTEIALGQFAQHINTDIPGEVPEETLDIITQLVENTKFIAAQNIQKIIAQTTQSFEEMNVHLESVKRVMDEYTEQKGLELDEYLALTLSDVLEEIGKEIDKAKEQVNMAKNYAMAASTSAQNSRNYSTTAGNYASAASSSAKAAAASAKQAQEAAKSFVDKVGSLNAYVNSSGDLIVEVEA